MIIQETIGVISYKVFEKCFMKPGDSLSRREATCVQAVSLKWLDTNHKSVYGCQDAKEDECRAAES